MGIYKLNRVRQNAADSRAFLRGMTFSILRIFDPLTNIDGENQLNLLMQNLLRYKKYTH